MTLEKIDRKKPYEIRGKVRVLKNMVLTDEGRDNRWGLITFCRRSTYDRNGQDLDAYCCSKESLIKVEEGVITINHEPLGTSRIIPIDRRHLDYLKRIQEAQR